MAADEQRRQFRLDLVELKNLQTIVFDLEELKQLHFISKRPRVRSILSREISNLEAKIVSNSTYSDEKVPEEDSGGIKFSEMGSKRKHKEIYEPQSSKMKKKTKLSNIKEPHVMNGSSCKSTKEEQNQQSLQTRNFEQVLQETANPSDVNEASPTTVIATENADVSNKMSQTVPLPGAAAFSGYRLGSPGKMSWCRRCQLPTHTESECSRRNGTIFKCQVAGHFIANCPKVYRDGISSSGARTVTAGSSCQSMQEEPNQLSLSTRTSEQVLWKNANPSDINEASPMTVVATESAGVSNKTSQPTPSPGAVASLQSRLGSPGKGSWCCTCRLSTHAESECSRRNGTCFRCHKAGHFVANCPKAPRDGMSSSGARRVTAGISCQSTQEEPNQHSLPTGTSEQVLPAKANSSDVDESCTMAVVATENADVSNKTSQTTPSPATTAASRSRRGCSRRRPWCHTCRLPHAESDCSCRNGPDVNCHETGNFMENCPQPPQYAISSTKTRTVAAASRCESMQNELHQQSLPTRTSEQVLPEKANSSDVNETCTMAVAATENADVSNKTSQTTPPPATTAASRSRRGRSRRRPWCRTCRLPHAESDCLRRNGPDVNCHETGNFMENCPQPPQYVISPSEIRTVAAGSRCESMQDELHQQSLPTRTSEQVLPEKANSSDVNETSTLAVVATENADVSNKTSYTTPSPATMAASRSRRGRSRRRPWCRTCQLPHAESDCSRRNDPDVNCYESGNFMENCPRPPQYVISPNVTRTVAAESTCESMQDELHQQSLPTRTSEQVLPEKANSSDVNETTTLAVVAAENADVSNKMSYSTPSPATTAASRSRRGRARRRLWCRTCRLPHAESDCLRRNGPDVNCHEMGNFMENCPKPPQYVISPSEMRTVAAGSRCESMEDELHQQSLPTRTSDQVLPEKASSSDVNETSTIAVVATENADVSNKMSQTTPSPATTAASGSGRGRSHTRPWCCTCQLPYAESECSRRNGPCVYCHETGHFVKNCPKLSRKRSWCHACQSPHTRSECLRRKRSCFKCCRMGHFAEECPWAPQNAMNPSGTTIIAVGGNTVVHALLYEEPWEETDSIRAEK